MKSVACSRSGLSLVEVIVVIAAIVTIGALVLPMLARPRGCRSPRISCTSNLKQVGLSYRLFANDHGDLFPFALSNEYGGTLGFVNSPKVFRHYEAMSNELVTPKILVCAEDGQRTRAANFLTSLSNGNVSYFVGLDAREDQPQTILSGDRNVTGGTLSNGFMRRLKADSSPGWAAGIHKEGGNIGLGDGSVQQVSKAGLARQVQAQSNPVIRLAMP